MNSRGPNLPRHRMAGPSQFGAGPRFHRDIMTPPQYIRLGTGTPIPQEALMQHLPPGRYSPTPGWRPPPPTRSLVEASRLQLQPVRPRHPVYSIPLDNMNCPTQPRNGLASPPRSSYMHMSQVFGHINICEANHMGAAAAAAPITVTARASAPALALASAAVGARAGAAADPVGEQRVRARPRRRHSASTGGGRGGAASGASRSQAQHLGTVRGGRGGRGAAAGSGRVLLSPRSAIWVDAPGQQAPAPGGECGRP